MATKRCQFTTMLAHVRLVHRQHAHDLPAKDQMESYYHFDVVQ